MRKQVEVKTRKHQIMKSADKFKTAQENLREIEQKLETYTEGKDIRRVIPKGRWYDASEIVAEICEEDRLKSLVW